MRTLKSLVVAAVAAFVLFGCLPECEPTNGGDAGGDEDSGQE